MIFHITNVLSGEPPGPVSSKSIAMAIQWSGYLENHARRIYDTLAGRESKATASLILEKVKLKAVADGFVARDIYSRDWSGLTESDEVEGALSLLTSLGYLQARKVDTGGRPKVTYLINPKIERTVKERA